YNDTQLAESLAEARWRLHGQGTPYTAEEIARFQRYFGVAPAVFWETFLDADDPQAAFRAFAIAHEQGHAVLDHRHAVTNPGTSGSGMTADDENELNDLAASEWAYQKLGLPLGHNHEAVTRKELSKRSAMVGRAVKQTNAPALEAWLRTGSPEDRVSRYETFLAKFYDKVLAGGPGPSEAEQIDYLASALTEAAREMGLRLPRYTQAPRIALTAPGAAAPAAAVMTAASVPPMEELEGTSLWELDHGLHDPPPAHHHPTAAQHLTPDRAPGEMIGPKLVIEAGRSPAHKPIGGFFHM